MSIGLISSHMGGRVLHEIVPRAQRGSRAGVSKEIAYDPSLSQAIIGYCPVHDPHPKFRQRRRHTQMPRQASHPITASDDAAANVLTVFLPPPSQPTTVKRRASRQPSLSRSRSRHWFWMDACARTDNHHGPLGSIKPAHLSTDGPQTKRPTARRSHRLDILPEDEHLIVINKPPEWSSIRLRQPVGNTCQRADHPLRPQPDRHQPCGRVLSTGSTRTIRRDDGCQD